MINNVVIVSGGEQRDSMLDIPISILPQTRFPPMLPHSTDQSTCAIK